MKPNELIEPFENIPKNDHNYHLYYLPVNNKDELMKEKCLKKKTTHKIGKYYIVKDKYGPVNKGYIIRYYYIIKK